MKNMYLLAKDTILNQRYVIKSSVTPVESSLGIYYVGSDEYLQCNVLIMEFFDISLMYREENGNVILRGAEFQKEFVQKKSQFLRLFKNQQTLENYGFALKPSNMFFENNTCYVVSILPAGNFVSKLGKLKEQTAIQYALTLSNYLSMLHENGNCFCDFSPEHTFIADNGEIFFISYESIKKESDTFSQFSLTTENQKYMPKEIFSDCWNKTSDVYGLASLVYYMIEGKYLKESKLRTEDKGKIEFSSNISETSKIAIQNALQLKLENRTKTLADFVNELQSSNVSERQETTTKYKKNINLDKLLKIIIPIVACVIVFSVIVLVKSHGNNSIEPESFSASENLIKVPNISENTLEDAKKILEDNNLSWNDQTGIIYSEKIPEGIVLSQDPSAGSNVQENTIINIYFSSGEKPLSMPNLYGMNKEKANEIIEKLGLNNVIFDGDGIITTQTPLPNKDIKKNDKITLQLTTPSEESPVTYALIVPDLLGINWLKRDTSLYENIGFGINAQQIAEDDPRNLDVAGIIVKMEIDGSEYKGGETIECEDINSKIITIYYSAGKHEKISLNNDSEKTTSNIENITTNKVESINNSTTTRETTTITQSTETTMTETQTTTKETTVTTVTTMTTTTEVISTTVTEAETIDKSPVVENYNLSYDEATQEYTFSGVIRGLNVDRATFILNQEIDMKVSGCYNSYGTSLTGVTIDGIEFNVKFKLKSEEKFSQVQFVKFEESKNFYFILS